MVSEKTPFNLHIIPSSSCITRLLLPVHRFPSLSTWCLLAFLVVSWWKRKLHKRVANLSSLIINRSSSSVFDDATQCHHQYNFSESVWYHLFYVHLLHCTACCPLWICTCYLLHWVFSAFVAFSYFGRVFCMAISTRFLGICYHGFKFHVVLVKMYYFDKLLKVDDNLFEGWQKLIRHHLTCNATMQDRGKQVHVINKLRSDHAKVYFSHTFHILLSNILVSCTPIKGIHEATW